MSILRTHSRPLPALLALLFLPIGSATAAELPGEAGSARAPRSLQQREAFLERAAILSEERLDIGVTGSRRATLSDGRFTHDAHIQTVNERHARFTTSRGVFYNFHDSYRFNIAAYRVAVMVGLERMVPVSVERRVGKERAALTWWVDDVQMMEADRLRAGTVPPEVVSFSHQLRQARIFSELIQNVDFNAGNLLITDDWKLWMIDFTRSFRVNKRLLDPQNLAPRIDADLLDGMRRLDRERLTAELDGVLTRREMNTLLARRDRIVAHYDQQIVERGEVQLVCRERH